eukprot:gene33151-42874_t
MDLDENLIIFGDDFDDVYEFPLSQRVDHFIEWQSQLIDDNDILFRLKTYFQVHHDLRKADGKPHFAPTAFRPWFSMFFKFWKLSGKGDLKSLAPLLYEDLTTWETGYQEAHASDFTREEMIRFHNEADNSPDHTFWKAYASIATSFAARSSEPCNIQFISADDVDDSSSGGSTEEIN